MVGLEDVLGPLADELAERLAEAPGWRDRFTVLDRAFTRLADSGYEIDRLVAYAWHRIVDSGGTLLVGELATETGLTRQHLTRRFTSEYGLTPKQLARVVRFGRSHRLLRESERARRRRPEHGRISLADVATRCGYYDQAHLAREWNALAGCPPSAWLATEELPFAADQPEERLPSVQAGPAAMT